MARALVGYGAQVIRHVIRAKIEIGCSETTHARGSLAGVVLAPVTGARVCVAVRGSRRSVVLA